MGASDRKTYSPPMSESSRVFSATLLFFVAFYMLLVPLPPYLVELGLADWQVGLVLGSFGIAALVGRPLAGLASDQLGRRTVILAGVAIFVAGVLAVLPTGNVLVLMATRILQALGYIVVSTAATARITDPAPPARRGSTLACFGICAAMVGAGCTFRSGYGNINGWSGCIDVVQQPAKFFCHRAVIRSGCHE